MVVSGWSLEGCRPQTGTNRTQIVARVGNAELTLEEAKHHIDTARGGIDTQLRGYVSYWVNTELVYQEAKQLGIDRSEKFEDQLADARRRLAGQLLLDRTVYNDSETANDEALLAYYSAHTSEFFIHDDLMKLNLAAFSSRERAGAFAARIAQGLQWSEAIADLQKDSIAPSGLQSSTIGEYFTAHTLVPQELWKVAQALDRNEVSFPVKVPSGFMIVQLLGSFTRGAPATFELSRDEVRQRFLVEHRRQRYEHLLANLRKKYSVQLLLASPHISDSVRTHE